jgi:hypothetical protein
VKPSGPPSEDSGSEATQVVPQATPPARPGPEPTQVVQPGAPIPPPYSPPGGIPPAPGQPGGPPPQGYGPPPGYGAPPQYGAPQQDWSGGQPGGYGQPGQQQWGGQPQQQWGGQPQQGQWGGTAAQSGGAYPVARPKEVDTAYLVFTIGGGLSVLAGILALFSSPFSGIINILVGGGVIALAWFMRSGQDWARLFLMILAGVGIALLILSMIILLSFAGGYAIIPILIMLIEAAALGFGIYLLLQPNSTAWFKAQQAQPGAPRY